MFYKKKVCYVLILALCLLQITACKKGYQEKDSNNSSVEVFTINETVIHLDEVLYRVFEMEKQNASYSKDYQEQYGESYWDSEIVDGVAVRDSLKEQLYDDIVRDILLYQDAVKNGVTLTEEEKTDCEKEAETDLSLMSEEEKKSVGVSRKLLDMLQERKLIISKYFSSLLDTYEVDEEAIRKSLELDEYQQYDVQMIEFSKFHYGDDGTEIPKSEEENQMGLESLERIADKAKQISDLNDLLEEEDTLETEDISIIPGESACEQQLEDTAKVLKPGETSDIIETDKGYYIMKLVSNSKKEDSEEEVASAVMREKYKQFDEYLETVKEKADIKTTGEWDNIKVGGTISKETNN